MSLFNGVRSNSPASEVMRVNFTPVVVDVAVTVAPGTTAPVESVTVPLISPLPESCAFAEEPHSSATAVRTSSNRVNTRSFNGPRPSVNFLLVNSFITNLQRNLAYSTVLHGPKDPPSLIGN